MSNSKHNLDKLKELCRELNDRDEQLKINASALWQILEVTTSVQGSLKDIKSDNKKVLDEIRKCSDKLDGINSIIAEKGCRKVANGH